MRIANKSSLTRGVLWIVLGICAPLTAASMTSARADNAPLPIPPAPVAVSAPTPPPALSPAAPAGLVPPAPLAASSGDMTKTIAAMDDKATDSAKASLKNLDGTEPLTMEDYNRARQTVARIDAMIDIEKRLNELEKLRGDKGGSSTNFANAIPASALTPMPKPISHLPSFPTAQEMPVAMHVAPSKPEISRIVGADGKYEALLKMSDGDLRTVRIGDTVNNSTVRWITASAVGLDEKGQTSVLHVKNVDIVSSALR